MEGIDVYQLGHEVPIRHVTFTEEQAISPVPTTSKGQLPPTEVTRHVRDTYFANVFRKYVANGRFDHDDELLDNFRDLITTHLERMVSIGMVKSDLTASITEAGINISADERLFDISEKMLEARFIEQAIALFGLSRYQDEIMLREIDISFGTATQLAAERRQQERKDKDREEWFHSTVSSVHNMMRELVTATTAGTGVPEPTSIYKRRPLPDYLRQRNERRQDTQTDTDTEESEE